MRRTGRAAARRLVPALAVVVAAALLAGAAFAVMGSRQVVPGVVGCTLVRQHEPRAKCMERELGALVDENVDRGLAAVDRHADANPLVRDHCHMALHPVGERHGRRAAERDGDARSLRTGTRCQEGYAHGFIIGFMDQAPERGIEHRVVEVCHSTGAGDDDRVANCIHAFGHVLLRNRGDLREALEACDELGRNLRNLPAPAGAGTHCAWGAHMEQAAADATDARATTAAATRKHDRCNRIAQRHQLICYAFLPVRIGIMGGDAAVAARACRELPRDGAHRAACAATWGGSMRTPDRCNAAFTEPGARQACTRASTLDETADAPPAVLLPRGSAT